MRNNKRRIIGRSYIVIKDGKYSFFPDPNRKRYRKRFYLWYRPSKSNNETTSYVAR